MDKVSELCIRVLLVDAHEVTRIGLRTLLENGHFSIVGECGSCWEAIDAARALNPDLIVMDTHLSDTSGLEACLEIRNLMPQSRILLLSSHFQRDSAIAAMLAGAHGYQLKTLTAGSLVQCLHSIMEGHYAFDSQLQKLRSVSVSVDRPRPPFVQIAPQEQKVLALVADGLTNKEIARRLALSERTVKNYLSNIFLKLNVTRRSEAASLYTRLSILSTDDVAY